MKLSLKRSGGFANIPFAVDVDSTKLSEDRQGLLDGLVGKVLPFTAEKPAPMPDVCSYELTIEAADGAQHTLSANDTTLTDDLQSLLDFLMAD